MARPLKKRPLEKRRLGKTGMEITLLGFGCIKFPHISAQQAADALDRALDLGVNFIDTARGYRDSEEKIGPVLKRRRSEAYIATKSGQRSAAKMMADLETSLRNLKTDYLDLYQAHYVCDEENLDKVLAPGGALEAMQKAKQQGKVRHLGITMHCHHKAMRRAIETDLFETIMLAYSPLDHEAVAAEIIPLAAQHDMGIIIMKPLMGGALVSPPDPSRPDGADPIVAGALRAIASHPAISTVIPGMISPAQVDANYASVTTAGSWHEAARRELMQRIGALKVEDQMCLACGYCLPCSQGINIPAVFRALHMHRNWSAEQSFLGRELYESLDVPADACAECKECLARCPAGIPISDRMKEAVAAFGPRGKKK